MAPEEKQRIATFRFVVIGDLVTSNLEPGEQERLIAEKIRRKWRIPLSSRTHISRSTILRWVKRYKDSGNKIESLYPEDRNDRGKTRAIDDETAQNLTLLRKDMPKAPVHKLIEAVRQKNLITPGLYLSRTTVYRFLHRHHLMHDTSQPTDRRKFEAKLPNDLWQSDVMHGPQVLNEGRLKKTYLIAFIDDHSRLIPHAQFFFSEGVQCYLSALEHALVTRGLPRKLYVDNGSAFRSHHLEMVTASLGIALIHATPYTPQGKGKIERFFRSVRSGFLLDAPTTHVDDLNAAFATWLQETYHQRKHSATGQTPFDRFTADIHCLRIAPNDLKDHFRTRARRRVAKDRTVTLDGRLYEAPVALIGQHVELFFHPQDPECVEIKFQQKSYGMLPLVNLAVNCRVKRDKNSQIQINTPCSSGKLF
jgi:transposase InsO family protein